MSIEKTEMIERDTKRYSDFAYWGERPLFDTWGVWKSQALTRDSQIISESNWTEILKALKEIEPEGENWEVFQASHWACGWIDQIIYNTECEAIVEKLVELECAIDDYPILNEDDWSERESEAVQKYWSELSLNEKIEYCAENDTSIFAARLDYAPDKVDMYLRDCVIR